MSTIQITPIRFLLAPLAFLAAAGCSDPGGPSGSQDPGVLLVTLIQGGEHLVWTSDGTEVVYAVSSALNAVNASTQMVRQLDVTPSMPVLSFCSAGQRIYFSASMAAPGVNDPNFRVSRVNPTAGAAEILTTTRWHGIGRVEVSADERFLVANPVLNDLQTGAHVDLPVGAPFGFSPDGTQLLYYQSQDGFLIGVPKLISTADGSSSQPLHSPVGSLYYGHRWEGNSPQLLESGFDNDELRLFEIDGVTGVTRDLARFGSNPGFPMIFPLANWSADGRTLAVWIQQGSGASRRSNLYIVRAGAAPVVVASVITDGRTGVGKPVFSPAGTSVAYTYYLEGGSRNLYLKSGI